MKLGSIVGLIVAGILVISGIILCCIGSGKAEASGELLFTQKSETGTYYNETISNEITKLSLDLEDADIVINGGAEESGIELINFNPNLYSISSTRNVISFSEISDLKSIMNIWENKIAFKGLRYLLDFRTYDFDDTDRQIVINISNDSELKILDIEAERCKLTVNDLSLRGDLLLAITEGDIEINGFNTPSTLSISGENIRASVLGSVSKTFRYTVDNGQIVIKESNFKDAQMTAVSGRIDYYATKDLGKSNVSITSVSGGILVNSAPHTGFYTVTNEEPEGTISIKTTSAAVLIDYPIDEKTEENENQNE